MKYSGICLITNNIPALVRFYSMIFRCQPVGDDTHSEFCIAGLNLAIFSVAGMEEMAPGSMANAGYGSFTIGFAVDDVDAEYERLKAFDISFVKLPATHPWGARSFWFRDPDGNIIDFYTHVPE